jgi:hypothetical protein
MCSSGIIFDSNAAVLQASHSFRIESARMTVPGPGDLSFLAMLYTVRCAAQRLYAVCCKLRAYPLAMRAYEVRPEGQLEESRIPIHVRSSRVLEQTTLGATHFEPLE